MEAGRAVTAAILLGDGYYEGRHGLPKDKDQALHWYEMVACATHKQLTAEAVERAAQRVRELLSKA